jgi:hypothetical protein
MKFTSLFVRIALTFIVALAVAGISPSSALAKEGGVSPELEARLSALEARVQALEGGAHWKAPPRHWERPPRHWKTPPRHWETA